MINVPDLYMKEATYDKTINNIYIYNQYAYLSTAFGIVKMNVSNGSIADSYQLGFQVDYCYIEGNYICDKKILIYEEISIPYYIMCYSRRM